MQKETVSGRGSKTFVVTMLISLTLIGGLAYRYKGAIFGENASFKKIGTSKMLDVRNIFVNRSDIEAATADLSALLSQARIAPVMSADGKSVDGLSVQHLEPNSLYEKLGLAEGDVVLGINNKKLFTPSDTMSIYNILKSSDRIEVNVQRNGRALTLNYEISDSK